MGEIAQIGEHADALETKYDDLMQYVQALEEENSALKHTVSQLKLQQEDMENRERNQNLRILGVSEFAGDSNLLPYLLSRYTTLAPDTAYIDWRLDRAHRSLGLKITRWSDIQEYHCTVPLL